jgi:ubiquitin-protein ligase
MNQTNEVGPNEVGPNEVGPNEVGPNEVGPNEVGPNEVVISKATFRRLIKDVKELHLEPLTAHGIHYVHNEEDILKGKALIIGPSDTPYENGFYLFEFRFPTNYPHSPPILKFCTTDGLTRFNPNLYTQGKVCLSILNTWQGDQWTGCQTISTVLLSLCTLLNDKPLLNEPGITEKHTDFVKYTKIITYKNFETAMLSVLLNECIIGDFSLFKDVMKNHFLDNFDKNLKRLNELCIIFPHKERCHTALYRMDVTLDYKKLLNKFNRIYNN